MLNPWIIEEILKREQEQRDRERPRAELPVGGPSQYHDSPDQPPAVKPPERGVAIMDI
jgi:hypothetical protein